VDPKHLELSVSNQGKEENSALLSSSLFSILYPVFHEFSGQAISTNGRRTSLTVSYECFTWLSYRTPSPLFKKLIHHLSRSVSPLVGLKNLGKILQPDSLSLVSPLEVI